MFLPRQRGGWPPWMAQTDEACGAFLGAQAPCPLERSRTFGPLWAGCPRSQEGVAKTRLDCKDDGSSEVSRTPAPETVRSVAR